MERFEIADSRICSQCGARAGQCDHLKADAHTRLISRSKDINAPDKWEDHELAAAARLRSMGLAYHVIAERLGRTENSCKVAVNRRAA